MADRLLTWFIWGWVALAVLVNLASIAAHILVAPNFWTGLGDVLGWFSPYNIANYAMEALLLSPAIAALWVRGRLRQRRAGKLPIKKMNEL